MNLALNIPINPTSFGQVSYNILYEIFRKGEEPCIFPIGNVDLNSYSVPEGFPEWLSTCIGKAPSKHQRTTPIFKLWHTNGLLDGFSNETVAMTFHETSEITETEKNILKQQKKILVSSEYTKTVFEEGGLDNVEYCPLGYDSNHFYKTGKKYLGKEIICFGLRGKLEERKNTLRILKVWSKKFGGDQKYRLDCSINNPFMRPEDQKRMILEALEGDVPWNINFVPYQTKNEVYNDALNAVDIDLTGMSSCEGFNLPLFQSLCLGKWAVVLNAHVHQDYCSDENSVLVPPSGSKVAEDGIFFAQGQPFNQGKWFDFKDEDFEEALDKVVDLAKTPNPKGEELAEKFTYSKMTNTILEELE